ncbi:unnamed protein product [Brassica rapa subsp. narinosa]
MLISFGFFFSLPRFSKIFLTEGIHSVSEASRSINGREFICLYEKDSAEIVVKKPKRSHLFLKMIVLVFAMVCSLHLLRLLKPVYCPNLTTCSNSYHYSDSLPKARDFQ